MPPFKPETLMASRLYMTPSKTETISSLVIGKALPMRYPREIATMALTIYSRESNRIASLFNPKNACICFIEVS